MVVTKMFFDRQLIIRESPKQGKKSIRIGRKAPLAAEAVKLNPKPNNTSL